MTDPDPNPFTDDCNVIICFGAAKPEDKHTASIIRAVDDGIISWLERREQRQRKTPRLRRGIELRI